MFRSRHFACLAVLVTIAGSAYAQEVDLTEGPQVDRFFRIDLTMKLDGNVKVLQEGKTIERPISLEARHEYVEKVLQIADGVVDKTVRSYQNAWALAKGEGKLTFRPNRTLMVVQRVNGQTIAYCPKGNLTQDELKLTEHFNSMALSGLLPGKPVKVGDSWPVPRAVAQTLFALEGLVDNDLTCKLEAVQNNLAQVRVSGKVNGIDLGSEVKIGIVQALCAFDLKLQRIVSLDWKQSDEREQGPVSPALSATIDIKLERAAVGEPPPELGPVPLGGMLSSGPVPASLLPISTADLGQRFEIQYSRDWILTAQTRQHTVWRLMNRGDLVAQVTVTPWKKLPAGSMVTPKQFLEYLAETPSWKEANNGGQPKELNGLPAGNRALRHEASGKLDGVDVVQYFYVLAGRNGDHLLVTFTLSPDQDKELQQRDLSFVGGISFP